MPLTRPAPADPVPGRPVGAVPRADRGDQIEPGPGRRDAPPPVERSPVRLPAGAVALVAVDGVDELDARHGPRVGTRVLDVVAERLGALRAATSVERLSRSVLSVHSPTLAPDALAAALVALGRRPVDLGVELVALTVSVGVAAAPPAPSPEPVPAGTRRALARARTAGGDRWVLADDGA